MDSEEGEEGDVSYPVISRVRRGGEEGGSEDDDGGGGDSEDSARRHRRRCRRCRRRCGLQSPDECDLRDCGLEPKPATLPDPASGKSELTCEFDWICKWDPATCFWAYYCVPVPQGGSNPSGK